MKNEKRHFTAEFKVQLLREHLENQVPVAKICQQHYINPNVFYLWKKDLFNGALNTFSNKKSGRTVEDGKITKLEEKLKHQDPLISEIVEDNLRLKKR